MLSILLRKSLQETMNKLIEELTDLADIPHDVAGAQETIRKAAHTLTKAIQLEEVVVDILDGYFYELSLTDRVRLKEALLEFGNYKE